MPKTDSLNKLTILRLRQDYKQFNFVSADVFYWSAKNQTIYYRASALKIDHGFQQLLHELGHATKNHTTFHSSIALLKMEVEAWEVARQLASVYSLKINENHIENCLNSYRDWLHLRASCPECNSTGLETEDCRFRCFNCNKKWSVPTDQQRRCYRKVNLN